MVKLSILTLNCRGINKTIKRRSLFSKCYKSNIIFLQETYITDDKFDTWKEGWKGKMFHSPGSNNSNGLITLVHENFVNNSESIFYRSQRVLGIKSIIDDEPYFFINFYAPSTTKLEKQNFLNELYHVSAICSNNNIIMGGDLNLVLDNDLDIIAGDKHDITCIERINNMLVRRDLIDSWRYQHAEERDFTWARYNPFCARRLDYIFIHSDFIPALIKTSHSFVTGSDHKSVSCLISTEEFQRGKSYWKLNTALLTDNEYINFMNSELDNFMTLDIPDPIDRFEYLKIFVKTKSIAYSKERSKENNIRHTVLQATIQSCNKKLITNPNDEVNIENLFKAKKELEVFELEKAKGAMARSRMKEVTMGEKNTNYFLGVEKSNGNDNTIYKLETDSGEIRDQEAILGEITKHFDKLYSKDNNLTKDNLDGIKDYINDINHDKISDSDKNLLETNLSIEEVGKALFGLSNDASPGIDGIPAGWYKVFYNRIKLLLHKSLEKAIDNGELGTSQRLGVISLIHKGKELSKFKLKNWRPISITNSDYKILSKCIAERLHRVLDSIINISQTGFMRGRSIADNIRIIDDIINLANKFNSPGMIVSLDFEKAFDSISRQTILDSLVFFNFGPNFIQMVATLLNNAECCIQNGGILTSWISCQRGIRQGCNASPLLFLITLELMSIKLRNSNSIQGISFRHLNSVSDPIKVIQYCDDTTLILNSDAELIAALKLIDEFYEVAGLKLNKSKSIAIRLGSSKDDENRTGDISWKNKNELIKILGVFFNSKQEASDIKENWYPKLDKIRELSVKLRKRKVSLWGRIILCKTFLLSQISFNIQALSMPDEVLVELDKICFKYIWQSQSNNKKVIEKIKRQVMCMTKEEGGAGMIKSGTQQRLFLIKWILKLNEDTNSFYKKTKIPFIFLDYFGGLDYVTSMSCSQKEITFPFLWSRFWKDAILSWLVLKHNVIKLFEMRHSLGQTLIDSSMNNIPIFCNNNIRYKGKILLDTKWIKRGVKYTNQILNDMNTTIPYKDLPQSIRSLPDSMFTYNALKNAIDKSIRECLNNYELNLFKVRKLKNESLRKILELDDQMEVNGRAFWLRKFGIDILDYYKSSLECIKETKMKVLLFKIYHKILPTKVMLKRWNLSETENCECGEKDIIEHSLLDCPTLFHLWESVENTIKLVLDGRHIPISKINKLFGFSHEEKRNLKLTKENFIILNNILIVAKFSINKTRALKLGSYKTCFETEWCYRENLFVSVT